LDGNGFYRIARIMGKLFRKEYRHQTIMHCKNSRIKSLSRRRKQEKMDVLEMDELYTYIKKKREEQEYGLMLIWGSCALLHLK